MFYKWKWTGGFLPGASTPEDTREGKKDKEGDRTSEEGKQKGKGSKPLMPTSTILRLLAELVRSYVGIATLIANYSYTVGQSELIKEVMFLVFPFSVILWSFGYLLDSVGNSWMPNIHLMPKEQLGFSPWCQAVRVIREIS